MALLFYGTWLLAAVALTIGTYFLVANVGATQLREVTERASAASAALEQTLLRALEPARTVHTLAETRARLLAERRDGAAAVITQQILEIVWQHRFGLLGAAVLRPDGTAEWASDPSLLDEATLPGGTMPARPGELAISRPTRPADARAGSQVLYAGRIITGADGATLGTALAILDPRALAGMMMRIAGDVGGAGLVERISDGAILMRAGSAADTGAAVAEEARRLAARGETSATLHVLQDGRDWLVALRVAAGVPAVVSASLDSAAALGDYHRLRLVLLAALAAFALFSFVLARLLLNAYLLRYRMGEQAMRDPLTGLGNRRYLSDVLAQRVAQAQRQGLSVALLLIDLDGFKPVNDTRGHAAGDALLRQVATRLEACASGGDAVLRLGGDEFAMLRTGPLQRRDSTGLARFVVSELGRPFDLDQQTVRISASVGVATAPQAGTDIADLLRSADIALYLVKSQGGAGYRMFDLAMEETVRTRRALEIDLRDAAANGELEVFFQPLVRLAPRGVTGFEALVRWHHPSFGLVLPSRFIPLSEETGLIHDLGAWVLRQACAEAARWSGGERIAVNLSPVQFDRPDIVDVVDDALRTSGIDPRRLELEITEGVVMRESGGVPATMRRLRDLGVRLALDDFGTGYASLSYLRSFPFDKVKIDGSFLSDLHGDGGTIIRAVLGLCGTLGLETLVEGVETEAQLDWLIAEGCGQVQGHFFSPPRPAPLLPDIVRRIAASGEETCLAA